MRPSAKTAGAVVVVLASVCADGARGNAARFDWSMPSRFGHAAQSAAQVQGGPFEVELRPRAVACEPGARRRWTVGGRRVRPRRLGEGCGFRLGFEQEGVYELALRVKGKGRERRFQRRVVVQDFVIVAIGDSVASGEGNPDNRSFIRPVWQNRRCHRSALAGMARAAALAEAADRRSSVTFVHLACSGATVPMGLTGGYRGAEAGFAPRPRLLPPQLEELREVARKREIDAVLVSVGANDTGFVSILAFCVTQPRCYERRIRQTRLGLPSREKRPLDEAVAAAVDRLPERYAELDAGFPQRLSRRRVLILEYFDSTHRTRDQFCERILGGVRGDEVRWAFENVIVPLNAAVRDAAKEHGWRPVSGIAERFAGHGYCVGRERWVRRLDESLAQQGFLNPRGTLHPSEEGHVQTAELIDARLRPALFPGGRAREPSPPRQGQAAAQDENVVPAAAAVDESETKEDDDGTSWVLWVLVGVGLAAAVGTAVVVLR